jgi:hypothetical protein
MPRLRIRGATEGGEPGIHGPRLTCQRAGGVPIGGRSMLHAPLKPLPIIFSGTMILS